MPLSAGITLLTGHYRIERLIGEGGMARVWLAEDLFLRRQVALKEPRRDVLSATVVQQQFRHECQLSAQLMHVRAPHVVPVWTVESCEDTFLLVMEYLAGGSLETLLQGSAQGLSPERAVQITREVLLALEALHALPGHPVHRDIKPSNILFDEHGQAHLSDFGVAWRVAGGGETQLLVLERMGSRFYAPLEQLVPGPHLTAATDLFAVGCVLFEMLTGNKYRSLPSGTRLGTIRPGSPAWLEALLARATQEAAAQRYASAAEMAVALAAGGVAPVTVAPPPLVVHTTPEVPPKNTPDPAPGMPFALPEDAAQRYAGVAALVPKEGAPASAVVPPRGAGATQGAPTNSTPARTPGASSAPPRGAAQRDASAAASVAALAPKKGGPAPVVVPPRVVGATQGTPPKSTPTPAPRAPFALPGESAKDALVLTLAPGVQLELVRVSAGEFIMGSDKRVDKGAHKWELPQYRVVLDEYLIGKCPVTVAQFRAFVRATGHKGWRDSCDREDHHPVVDVTWDDAVTFCAWASQFVGRNVRLPTEAQWEKAARGTDGRIYPWGNEPPADQHCNFNMHVGDTTPVGQYSPQGDSPYGCADMAGTVWEWTNSLHMSYPYRPDDGREDARSRGARAVRGGSFRSDARGVRAADRFGFGPDSRLSFVGFRTCVVLT